MKTPIIDPADLSDSDSAHLAQKSYPRDAPGDFIVKMPTGSFLQPFGFAAHAGDRARGIVQKFGK